MFIPWLTHLDNASHTERRWHGYLDEVELFSNVNMVIKEGLQYDRTFSLTSQEGRPLKSRNERKCLHQTFWKMNWENEVTGYTHTTYCWTSSTERSMTSFPWTMPALLIRMVGSPICRKHWTMPIARDNELTSVKIFWETTSTSSHFETSHW